MKKYQLLLITLFTSALSFAQVTVCLGDDATVCQGQTVQITNCAGSGGSGTGGIFLNAPTSVPLSDDNWSGSIAIGFPFSFYGATYNNLLIGANGTVTFNTAQAGGYCPWSLNGTPLPSGAATGSINAAMVAYQDLNPANSNSGPVQYQLMGTAPNRKFVVLYNGVTMFSCTNSCSYMGYIFYEGTNIIEMFIGDKGACATWNSGLAIQGTQNNGSPYVAHVTPGRNNTNWNANQDGRRWTPTSSTNTTAYTISQIPYVNINAPGGNLQWTNSLNQFFPYNNGVLNVVLVPPGQTRYWLVGTSCGQSVGSVSDTTTITRSSVTGTATATTDFCGGGSGTATANPGLGTAPFTYLWTPSAQTGQTATNLVTGAYQVKITDANGCFVNVNVTVPNSTATFTGTTTIVSCPGGTDGTATANMTPSLGTISYLWNDPAAQTTQTATGLAAGTYTCTVTSSTGCVGTVTVTVTQIPGMTASILTQQDPGCNSGSDGIIAVNVTGGTPTYSYSWNNSASTAQAANDLAAGAHTVTITDQNGCVISLSATLTEPAPLAISMLTPNAIICPENSTVLEAQGTGGNVPSAYTFTWTENGVPIGTGATITVNPVDSGTVYCVTLSEACGSPVTDSCMMITFPTAIDPEFVADKISACQPGEFLFTNTSNNPTEIESVFFEFGDGQDALLTGAEDTSHVYVNAQSYTVKATVTSIHGCVTTAEFPGIVTVIAKPTADFNFSSNPTTIFETMVVMQDKSSAGVNSWQWSSPGSTPAASTSENPTFHFPDGVVGTYPVQLIVTTPEGCIDTVEHILHVNADVLFFAPNAFTPDGDEFNQTWDFSVIGVDEYNFELMIFNRWGEVIWETHDINATWDGTYHGQIVAAGAYSWTAKVKHLDTDAYEKFQGVMNVFR